MFRREFHGSTVDRRRFLGLVGGVGCALASGGMNAAFAATTVPRGLSFYNIHTREALSLVYWRDGRYLGDALAAIDHHLRDFRTGDVRPIDAHLLDLLNALNGRLGHAHPLHVISGYRCPETNAMLARRSNQVARNSYHVKGMAIDVRSPAVPLTHLRDAALDLGWGGVGYYPGSDFVHLDTGPVRSW